MGIRLPTIRLPINHLRRCGAGSSFMPFVGLEGRRHPPGERKNPVRDMTPGFVFSTDYGYGALHPHSGRRVMPSLGEGLAQTERPWLRAASAHLGTHRSPPRGVISLIGDWWYQWDGNVASTMFTTPRLTYAMGRDGKLPEFLCPGFIRSITHRFGSGLVFFSRACFRVVGLRFFVWLAALSALVRILIYMLVASLPFRRAQKRHKHR